MQIPQGSQVQAARVVDCLIKQHLAQQAQSHEDGVPVAAISPADRRRWARRAGVDREFVDVRLATICEAVSPTDREGSGRFRMKGE